MNNLKKKLNLFDYEKFLRDYSEQSAYYKTLIPQFRWTASCRMTTLIDTTTLPCQTSYHPTRRSIKNYINMNHNVEAHLLHGIPTGFLSEESPSECFHCSRWHSRTVEELVASIAEKRMLIYESPFTAIGRYSFRGARWMHLYLLGHTVRASGNYQFTRDTLPRDGIPEDRN